MPCSSRPLPSHHVGALRDERFVATTWTHEPSPVEFSEIRSSPSRAGESRGNRTLSRRVKSPLQYRCATDSLVGAQRIELCSEG